MKVFIYKNGTGELHTTIPDVLALDDGAKYIKITTKPVGGKEPNVIGYSKPEYYYRVLL